MKLGIDGSNLRDGGGITHLVELLRSVEPEQCLFSTVVVYGADATLEQINDRPWLTKTKLPIEAPLHYRVAWQRFELPKAVRLTGCDLLFAPGGLQGGNFHPVVTMCRNMLPFSQKERKRYGWTFTRVRLLLLRFAQARSFRSADGLIFLTQWAKLGIESDLRTRYKHARIVPHGISARFRREAKPQRPVEKYSMDRPFRWLYVSIVDTYKHQWCVAEAVATLRRKGVPICVDFVGPAYPPALARLQATLLNLDPEGKFLRYVGPVSYDDLHAYYHGADAFVFASSCENMPNILIEAMSAGLPIACSRMGPMPEVLGDGGLYFDPLNVENIAEVLHRMFRDPVLRARCAGIAANRASKYSWTRCADETFSFLAEVARKAQPN